VSELDSQFEVAVELDNARDERFGIPTLYAGTQFGSRLVWHCYRCGGGGKVYRGEPADFRALWRRAGNRTQWKSPR